MPLSNELSSATGPRGVSLLKRTQTPCSKSEIMKGQAGYRSVEHLSVQNQQSDSQPLLDSSYLVTVTLVSLNPNLAVHLPLSTFTHAYSSITFSHSFRILYTMDTASFFPPASRGWTFCEAALTAAIKHSGFSYLWPLREEKFWGPLDVFLVLLRLNDANFFGVLTQLSLCANMLISTNTGKYWSKEQWKSCCHPPCPHFTGGTFQCITLTNYWHLPTLAGPTPPQITPSASLLPQAVDFIAFMMLTSKLERL